MQSEFYKRRRPLDHASAALISNPAPSRATVRSILVAQAKSPRDGVWIQVMYREYHHLQVMSAADVLAPRRT